MSRLPPPPPPFVDDDRTVLAADPRDYWRSLLERAVFRDQGGYYVLTRRDDVRAALRDPTTFASARQQLAPAGAGTRTLPLPVPIAFDPPEHTRYRRILRPFFGLQAMEKLQPALHGLAAELVDAVEPIGACDAVRDVANPFPFAVLATLCGLPLRDTGRLAVWADVDWDAPGASSTSELLDYLLDAIASEQRPALAAQLLGGDDPLTEDEVIGLYSLLCFAQDGMQAGIGSALLHLVRDPALRAVLRGNPDKIRVFAEEVIRLETPLPFIGRFTTRAVTVDGVTIPAGSVVRLCLASANADDGEEPSVLITDDDGSRTQAHRSFGGGVHRCLGKALARMELTVMVTEWLRAIPDFELEPGFVPRFTFTQGGAITPSNLPLRWR